MFKIINKTFNEINTESLGEKRNKWNPDGFSMTKKKGTNLISEYVEIKITNNRINEKLVKNFIRDNENDFIIHIRNSGNSIVIDIWEKVSPLNSIDNLCLLKSSITYLDKNSGLEIIDRDFYRYATKNSFLDLAYFISRNRIKCKCFEDIYYISNLEDDDFDYFIKSCSSKYFEDTNDIIKNALSLVKIRQNNNCISNINRVYQNTHVPHMIFFLDGDGNAVCSTKKINVSLNDLRNNPRILIVEFQNIRKWFIPYFSDKKYQDLYDKIGFEGFNTDLTNNKLTKYINDNFDLVVTVTPQNILRKSGKIQNTPSFIQQIIW